MSDSVTPFPAGLSRTSIYVAAGRAIGARDPDPSTRNPDSLAEALLSDASISSLGLPILGALALAYDEAMRDPAVSGIVRAMTVRTRFIGEALVRAVAGGASQVVVLGAGFDTHAYRCRDLLAAVRVFEVDRPATQALKRARVEQALGGPPPNLTYVATDFADGDLPGVLSRHGCDPESSSFFVWEGVTMYLPEPAVRETLRFVASHPPGSGIVFDFVYRALVEMLARADPGRMSPPMQAFVGRFHDLTRDEPWLFGMPNRDERGFLAEHRLDARDVLAVGGEEAVRRYLTRADGTQVGVDSAAVRLRQAAGVRDIPEHVRERLRLMTYQIAEAVVVPAP